MQKIADVRTPTSIAAPRKAVADEVLRIEAKMRWKRIRAALKLAARALAAGGSLGAADPSEQTES